MIMAKSKWSSAHFWVAPERAFRFEAGYSARIPETHTSRTMNYREDQGVLISSEPYATGTIVAWLLCD